MYHLATCYVYCSGDDPRGRLWLWRAERKQPPGCYDPSRLMLGMMRRAAGENPPIPAAVRATPKALCWCGVMRVSAPPPRKQSTGDLLIGVADNGTLLGIEHDRLYSDDKYMRHLAQVVRNGLGDGASTHRSDDLDRRREDHLFRERQRLDARGRGRARRDNRRRRPGWGISDHRASRPLHPRRANSSLPAVEESREIGAG